MSDRRRQWVPTRQGLTVAATAIACGAVGRIFGILELYIIAAALVAALIVGFISVGVRRPRVTVRRWVRPLILTAGETARVELVARRAARGWSPRFELTEPVGRDRTARLAVSPLRAGRDVSAGYRIPTERRGVLPVGPLRASRHDVLGLARFDEIVTGPAEILVSPRAYALDMPILGQSVLGEEMQTIAQRLGPGDFHSLREYVVGDEPRIIHWKASARSDELKVRQHQMQTLRRVLVVLDQNSEGDSFERAVVVAASVVYSAMQEGFTTRLVTTDGADLRGPEVVEATMHLLARIDVDHSAPLPIERDVGDGIGMLVVITRDAARGPWSVVDPLMDPTMARVVVCTDGDTGTARMLRVDARSESDLVANWARIAGTHRHRTWLAPPTKAKSA